MALNGQERPFHIGTYQARVFCEQRGVELDEYQRVLSGLGSKTLKDSVLICDLVYSGLVAGAKLKKLPLDFDADEVSFWIDADPGEAAKFFEVANTLVATGPEPEKAPGKEPGPQLKK